jgi:tetratricopeptide (TPR) repeat protein
LGFSILAVVACLLVIEGILAVVGVRPVMKDEDPFVGFAGNVPLFVERTARDGQLVYATNRSKAVLFNAQHFDRRKRPNTYRVFCLGGSTTYGRPYSDATSFAGWLREFLPAAQPGRDWEVVNAGGISYASYRVAALMDELVEYDPDLFVVYTGHNEYLEERTYGEIRQIPAPVRALMATLAKTRTWAAIGRLLRPKEPTAGAVSDGRSILPPEVQARLDSSAGPAIYERDDELAEEILTHYRVSLERTIHRARQAGARVILVTPASNLKDCTPFKAESTEGVDEASRTRVAAWLQSCDSLEPAAALAVLDSAVALDPRNADVLFARGRALFELGRTDEAEEAFTRARDEDVCPLRALSSMQRVVEEIAKELDVPCVDYVELVRTASVERTGQPIPGEELFLDHVHPTVEGHRLLALALVEAMRREGIVTPASSWGEAKIAEVTEKVESGIDPSTHAQALANLSLTLNWAGKNEESRKLAMRALESGYEDATMLMMVGRHYSLAGDDERALHYFLRAVAASPNSPVVHSQIGMLQSGRGDLEAAAAHFFLATLLWDDNDVYHEQLATVLNQRGRLRNALRSLQSALEINPADEDLQRRVERQRQALPESDRRPRAAGVQVTRHDTGFPRTVAQTVIGPGGGEIRDGIWTEWRADGTLKAYADYRAGKRIGGLIRWESEGERIP